MSGARAQAWAVAAYEMRRLRRGAPGRMRLAFLLLPLLLSCGWAALLLARAEHPFADPLVLPRGTTLAAATRLGNLAEMFRLFVLPFVLFLAAADLFGNLFRSEVADRTLHHLFLAPVRREVIAAGKYLAGVLVVSGTAALTWLACMVVLLLPHGPAAAARVLLSAEGLRQAALYLLVIVLAAAAYGGLFLAAGAVLRSPLPLAAGLWCWERCTAVLPRAFKMASVFFHLESLLPVRVAPQGALATVSDPSPPWVAVPVLLLVAAAGVAASAWLARRIEVRYSAGE